VKAVFERSKSSNASCVKNTGFKQVGKLNRALCKKRSMSCKEQED
jgi:hypothetical protein